ncbi:MULTISPECIES: NAD-dependent epimerase/dehydratase family protein [unclassified Paenibacillus]|uniref:NAD-dependent epimerase/dehydratase family protein n=1 Tax=Paenibacillus provencensis TaxID=441151 RepID=A0ABW3Q1F2_9BACL|nr:MULTISPECIES: NAD-dependent epimerase/dehydratase family protein [unclassified Paenibacillus]MCM3129582.1 NAD(P)H-binding protein [Paenibacillus sp. MER 78]SFS53591.1 Nucleoside-diphosphate-sugar epimerase [Paenibacillus sp. 453mf]
MKKAIVIGATGGTGAVIVSELVSREVPTIAFGRSKLKLEELAIKLGNPAHLSLAIGDACQPDDITAAVQGADVLFHSANVPYNEMVSKLIPLGESVMEAADRLSLKVVVIDGIYPYGRSQMDQVTEEHPKQPHTKKGRIRLAFEQMVFNSRWENARPMIVRLPDYYGPTANQASYLGGTLEAIASGKLAFFIGNMRIPREYIYLPDAANMIVELAGREQAYGENWNLPGSDIISGHEIVRIAQQASSTKKPVIALGKMGLSLLGLFVPVMKEVVEMLYLTEEPLRLSGEKYKRLIGEIPTTKPEVGIAATIRELQRKKNN